MSKKPIITKLVNRKPISITGLNTKQNEDGGVVMNYTETYISQIVKARNEQEFSYICSQIQEFIEKENIDACFVINKNELIDCLQEHQKLKFEIADLEAKLAESEKKANIYAHEIAFLDKKLEYNQKTALEDLIQMQNENAQLKQQLAEKEKELHYKTAECEKWQGDYENCSRLEKAMTKEHQYCLDNWRASEQSKTDLAIEQLEKVKEIMSKSDESGYIIRFSTMNDREKFNQVIDRQIKKLKEKK